MKSRFIYPIEEVDSSLVSIAGGKGSSLGELVRAAVPVPPAFVVTSAGFEAFMAAADEQRRVDEVLRELSADRIEIAEAEARIMGHLGGTPVPVDVAESIRRAVSELGSPRVSVRSSATCEDSGAQAWAGQLDTFLDIAPEDVVDRVRECWLSIFRKPALAYGAAHGYGGGQFAVAVVVQEMVDADVAGIGFSVHPVTQEPGVLLIEACLGLGEAIVSGEIAPDQYVVDRASSALLDRTVSRQKKGLFLEPGAAKPTWRPLGAAGAEQKLTDAQALEYADLLARIEDHYGHPVDTEWALQDGEFRVLQARPITTLAEEYNKSLIDLTEEWQLLVRRPMSLVEVSIWAHWLCSKHAGSTLGINTNRALSIQDDACIANDFLSKKEMDAGLGHVLDLLRSDRSEILARLEYGKSLHDNARRRIEEGAPSFRDLDEAAHFFIEVAQYTTAFPAWVLIAIAQGGIDDTEVRALAEGLRSDTLYPAIQRRIIDPLVARLTDEVGFSSPDDAATVTTWTELREGKVGRDTLESRLRDVRAGRRFVFQSLSDGERVDFVSQGGYLVMRLAQQRRGPQREDPNELRGQAAWPGVHRGRARVILSADAIGQSIEDGEVVVSIQSSPALMPLLKRSGAIVTDEGGVACHAAIICRELKKPTLIGTGSATSLIQTGDLVEVDTYAQVVRVLERA